MNMRFIYTQKNRLHSPTSEKQPHTEKAIQIHCGLSTWIEKLLTFVMLAVLLQITVYGAIVFQVLPVCV